MAIVDEVIIDLINASSSVEMTYEVALDGVDIFEFYQLGFEGGVTESATFTETLEILSNAHVVETAHIQDQLTYAVEATKDLVSTATFTDRADLGVTVEGISTGLIVDSAAVHLVVPVVETGSFTSTVVPVVTTGTTVTERAEFRDQLRVGLSQDVQEAAHFTDVLESQRFITVELNDTAHFTTSVGAGSLISMSLSDTAHFTTAVDHTAVTNAWAYSFGVFTSEVDYTDPNAAAWVMNTETTAMSQYKGYDFESIAQYKGVLYGVNRDGIFILEGNKDVGLSINSLLETGYMDFGIDEKKRIPNLYVGFTMVGGVIRVSTWSRKDANQKWHYDTPVVPYLQPVNSRFTLGKGLNHEYWKFALTNRNGAYFALDKWSADVAISARRIG